MSKLRIKPKSKSLWTTKGKAEFEKKAPRISTLIEDLQSLTINGPESRSIDRALPSMSLNPITDARMLHTLHTLKVRLCTALGMSAKVKLLQNTSAAISDRSATIVTNDRLHFLTDFSTLAILGLSHAGPLQAWIEWSIVYDGAAAPEYIRQIKALGYILQEAGDPSLRLPVCYGIFDDLAYEVQFGARRLGYVLSAPHAGHSSPAPLNSAAQATPRTKHEGNFYNHPPRTLNDLIRDSKSFAVPLLGDRFALTLTLATVFSSFHSAGWLHKGFHSGNIVFLPHTSGQETAIKVTDPFIIGFQYARPTGAHSLSRGPLENRELEYYYHSFAEKGLSRCIDIYSLGMALCEIGRWGLVGSTVSGRRRHTMVDRAA